MPGEPLHQRGLGCTSHPGKAQAVAEALQELGHAEERCHGDVPAHRGEQSSSSLGIPTANTTGKALHGSAEHSDPPQALLAAGQEVGPSKRESPASPWQHKPPRAQRQGRELEEAQSLCWNGLSGRESSKSCNHLPTCGTWGIGSAATAFTSAAS